MRVQDDNKALARRWFDEGWSRGNIGIAPEIFAAGFILGGQLVGPAGPQKSVQRIRSVFEPLAVTVDLQIAEDDLVATQYTANGRHAADYRGIPASGIWVSVSGVQIWRLADGMAIEDWNTFDEWSLMGQLGGGSVTREAPR